MLLELAYFLNSSVKRLGLWNMAHKQLRVAFLLQLDRVIRGGHCVLLKNGGADARLVLWCLGCLNWFAVLVNEKALAVRVCCGFDLWSSLGLNNVWTATQVFAGDSV